MKCICPQCSVVFDAKAGRVNRAKSINAPLYCGRVCSGLARRSKVEKTQEQKRAEKAEYDRNRRAKIGIALAEQKREWYRENRDRLLPKMAEYRKIRMPKHVEYCRRPEYKAYKHEYDMLRNESEYGDFAETWRLLQEVEKEIRSQASAYERRVANGYYLRSAQKRRRELCLIKSRKN